MTSKLVKTALTAVENSDQFILFVATDNTHTDTCLGWCWYESLSNSFSNFVYISSLHASSNHKPCTLEQSYMQYPKSTNTLVLFGNILYVKCRESVISRQPGITLHTSTYRDDLACSRTVGGGHMGLDHTSCMTLCAL